MVLEVAGSCPVIHPTFLEGPDRPSSNGLLRSSSASHAEPSVILFPRGPVWSGRQLVTLEIVGSNPIGGAILESRSYWKDAALSARR